MLNFLCEYVLFSWEMVLSFHQILTRAHNSKRLFKKATIKIFILYALLFLKLMYFVMVEYISKGLPEHELLGQFL